jgi:hypothetical protein
MAKRNGWGGAQDVAFRCILLRSGRVPKSRESVPKGTTLVPLTCAKEVLYRPAGSWKLEAGSWKLEGGRRGPRGPGTGWRRAAC